MKPIWILDLKEKDFMKKQLKLLRNAILILGPAGYFFPKITLVYIVCGLYDVLRNRNLDFSKIAQYFFGNGLLTWLLSPVNIVLDILTLPYINKGIYRLEDLPKAYAGEVQSLIDSAYKANLVGQLEDRIKDVSRSMVFFKWAGKNVDTFVEVPAYHEKYKYVQTIGVSVFNKQKSTSRHFGPLRATLRLLYNINDMTDNSAYIECGSTTHYWRENKLFIFDDTLMHQSFNKSDQVRYCLFVDILRPSILQPVITSIVHAFGFFLRGVNFIFYKNWKVLAK